MGTHCPPRFLHPSNTSTFSHATNHHDSLLTKPKNGFTTSYVYDGNNRLIREDDITYSYDDNGNLKEKNSAEENVKYFYDAENHLISVETTRFGVTITVEYEYDAEGNRVRKIIDGTIVTNYLVDTNRDYAQVLEERDGSGNLLVRYVYGHDLISQTRGGATTYYHYDGLGSTRALTNSAEAVTDTYTYDAFGLLLEQTGTTENTYLYRGEQFDPELGFYYLRARYMDPNVGRFVTMDPFSGISRDPYSLHKYLYANANPITYSDPSGYFSFSELNVGTVIRGILSRIGSFEYTAARNALYGGLFGAITSGFDAWFGGEDVLDAMIHGAKSGARFGILATIPIVRPILISLGFASSLEGIYDSTREGKYAQAALRTFVLYMQVRSLTNRVWDSEACFTEETLIYTKGGYKQIKDITVGDEVYAEDVGMGEKSLKRVKQVFVREVKVLIHLYIDGVEIKTTTDHPFWVSGEGWVPASQLNAGDGLSLYSGGNGKIISIKQEVLTQSIKVYNFKVERWHTYFVSEQKILVHNADYDRQVPQFVRTLKTVTTGIDCKELSKIVIRTFAPKGKIVMMWAKGGGDLPTQGDLPKNWDYHAASVFPPDSASPSHEQVYDPLLELFFPSVTAWRDFIVGSNDVLMEYGQPGSKMFYQLTDGTFEKL